jgi:hypothetical protein
MSILSAVSKADLLPRAYVALLGAAIMVCLSCQADEAQAVQSCLDGSTRSPAVVGRRTEGAIESADPSSSKPRKVRLAWDPSTPASSNPKDAVQGYNIYRRELDGEAGSKFEQINRILIRETSCTDYLVDPGHAYAYEVKAVSAGGAVSKPSNVATAKIQHR